MKTTVILILAMVLTISCSKKNDSPSPAAQTPTQAQEPGPAAKGASGALDPSVAADVNGQQIPMARLDEQLARRPGVKKLTNDKLNLVKSRLLDTMITMVLVDQELKARKISIPDEEISGLISKKIEEMGGEDKFKDYLAGSYTTLEEYRANLARDKAMVQLLDQISPIEISDEDVDKHVKAREKYREKRAQTVKIKISEILLRVAPDASDKDVEKSRDKLLKLRESIKGEMTFEEVARAHSMAISKKDGGNRDYQDLTNLPGPVADAVKTMEIGQISDPIRVDEGWYLIRVDARQGEMRQDMAEIRAESLRNLTNAAKQRRYTDFITKLKAEAKITISDTIR